MNIFFLSYDPIECAQMHVDRHVVKMILELAQLMCTAHHILDSTTADIYSATHVNHKCAVWVRANKSHYLYTYALFKALTDEYTYRYGKVHLTYTKLSAFLQNPPVNILDTEWIDPPCAMPEIYRDENVVTAYRNYYIYGKEHLHKYTKRSMPTWLVK